MYNSVFGVNIYCILVKRELLLKKSNNKVTKSIEIINMLISRIDMKTNFTQNECENIQNYIYLAMNNF